MGQECDNYMDNQFVICYERQEVSGFVPASGRCCGSCSGICGDGGGAGKSLWLVVGWFGKAPLPAPTFEFVHLLSLSCTKTRPSVSHPMSMSMQALTCMRTSMHAYIASMYACMRA